MSDKKIGIITGNGTVNNDGRGKQQLVMPHHVKQ